jgi:UDP-glucose 4-epimerase
MIRALVTGGAGFIGSHLVDRLVAMGCEVRVIDNLSIGRKSNIESHLSNPKFSFIEADVADYEQIEKHFSDVDWVFHLAARADIVPSIVDPLVYHRANVDGTMNVLMAARKHQVKRFIYSASSSCYGIPEKYPTPETAENRPQYPYALTKMVGEEYVMHWAQVYKLPAISLRFFNVFGPRARTSGTYGAVFGVFLAQLVNDKPLTVVGDGKQTRDFTYVTDIVDAIVTAVKSDITGQIFNVGSGGTYSINELVKLLGAKEIEYIPKRPGEPDATFADVSKINQALGWKASVSFSEGVNKLKSEIDRWKDAPLWNTGTIAEATKEWFKYLGAPK